jgi:uncharacterized protein YfaQ (DUF2300 family)
MTAPISVSADFEAGVILVRYRRLPQGVRIDHDEQIAPGATAGIDADHNVVSIELLSTSQSTLDAAAKYAHARSLAFPLDLSHLLEAA